MVSDAKLPIGKTLVASRRESRWHSRSPSSSKLSNSSMHFIHRLLLACLSPPWGSWRRKARVGKLGHSPALRVLHPILPTLVRTGNAHNLLFTEIHQNAHPVRLGLPVWRPLVAASYHSLTRSCSVGRPAPPGQRQGDHQSPQQQPSLRWSCARAVLCLGERCGRPRPRPLSVPCTALPHTRPPRAAHCFLPKLLLHFAVLPLKQTARALRDEPERLSGRAREEECQSSDPQPWCCSPVAFHVRSVQV